MASAIIAPESLTSAAYGNEHEIQERKSTVGSHLKSRHWRRRSFSFGRNSTGVALISRRRGSRLNVDDFFDDGEKLEHGWRQPVDARRQHLIARRKGLQKFSEFLAVTRVYRGYVLAALTRLLARRLCRLQPPPPSPAPCRVYDGRGRKSHRPALASRRYW